MYALRARAGARAGPLRQRGGEPLEVLALALPVRGVDPSFSLFRAYRAVPLSSPFLPLPTSPSGPGTPGDIRASATCPVMNAGHKTRMP